MDEVRQGEGDAGFVGEIPELYERLLVPMIFEEPAARLAAVIADRGPADILETAAGTGALTRELARLLPDARLVATDLNQPMIDAGHVPAATEHGVTWMQADALDLPFGDDSFDVVACQFGVMFFPDRVLGYREARRVLRSPGAFIFNAWTGLDHNDIPRVIENALNDAMPSAPLTFMGRIPHGYGSPERIRTDLEAAGFSKIELSTVDGVARTTAADAAVAFCQGTPLRLEIGKHPELTVGRATRIAEDAVRAAFGDGPIEGRIQWIEVVAAG